MQGIAAVLGATSVKPARNRRFDVRWAPIVALECLRFSGDITSMSKETVLGTYQALRPEVKRILLDLSKVEYINSSGIALIIQVLIEARKTGQSVQTFGLSDHFRKVFTMVGMTKYTELHEDELSACAAFPE
jgi:anti-sigma B factor antagonist